MSEIKDASASEVETEKKISDVLEYWIGAWSCPGFKGQLPDDAELVRLAPMWFKKDDATDAYLREHFGPLIPMAANGELSHWEETPHGSLALVILMDQFSRNCYRDSPQAFAQDPEALKVAARAIAKGFDQAVHPVARFFFYLPYEHSEAPEDQVTSIALFKSAAESYEGGEGKVQGLLNAGFQFAQSHKNVIDRFGRYPHRNQLLGRKSTQEEEEFLKTPGSSF